MQKTLPHALSRAAASGAVEVGPGRLANVLKTYAVTQDKVGTARTRMDEEIRYGVLSRPSRGANSLRPPASVRSFRRTKSTPRPRIKEERANLRGDS